MRTPRTQALLCVLPAAAMFLVACDKPSSGDGPATSASAPVTAPSASASASASALASALAVPTASAPQDGKHDGGRNRGVAGMLFKSARDLPDLKDPQKATLDTLETTLKADDGGAMKAEFKGMHDDMIAGIKAGKIDAAKMQAHYAAIDKAAQARQDKEVVALNGLYAALDAGQRKTLVAAVRAKQAVHDDKDKDHDHDKMMAGGDGGAGDWTKRRLDRMTKELGLDDGQQKQVAALLAKGPTPAQFDTFRADMKKRNEAVLGAFEKDGFDAKKLDLSMMPGKKAHDPMDQHVQFVTGLLGVLKPDQRDKLAASMDKMGHGDMPGGMPMGDRPMGWGSGMAEGHHDDD